MYDYLYYTFFLKKGFKLIPPIELYRSYLKKPLQYSENLLDTKT
jgi:hypothetical protein